MSTEIDTKQMLQDQVDRIAKNLIANAVFFSINFALLISVLGEF